MRRVVRLMILDCHAQPPETGSSRATSWRSARGLVAGHVLARDDREHRSQRGRELRLGLAEPLEEIADRGALSQVDGHERRGRKAREPGAEADTNRHPAASLTARRE